MTPPQTIQRRFGLAVRELREQTGMSQEELAAEAGLARSYYSGVERGVRNIGLANVGKVAAALGTTPSQIFAKAGL